MEDLEFQNLGRAGLDRHGFGRCWLDVLGVEGSGGLSESLGMRTKMKEWGKVLVAFCSETTVTAITGDHVYKWGWFIFLSYFAAGELENGGERSGFLRADSLQSPSNRVCVESSFGGASRRLHWVACFCFSSQFASSTKLSPTGSSRVVPGPRFHRTALDDQQLLRSQ
jgi:hypothetical protein